MGDADQVADRISSFQGVEITEKSVIRSFQEIRNRE